MTKTLTKTTFSPRCSNGMRIAPDIFRLRQFFVGTTATDEIEGNEQE